MKVAQPSGGMTQRVRRLLKGEGLRARALRGTALTVANTGGTQALRLASNLILTRLLFPEAFGLMALVQVFISGLQMFSDLGLKASIIQNERGDDPNFLNTAWTMQIVRGFLLWFGTCALAIPASNFYDEPLLAWLLPAVGLTTVIDGFKTTKTLTAKRHIRIGRVTVISLGCQAVGIALTILFAWLLESVWALVIGTLVSAVIGVIVNHRFLPGILNRLHWDPSAFRELFRFGKFIFLSSIAGFFVAHADRAIMGKFVTLTDLAVYSIGFFLAAFPSKMSGQIATAIIFPLYRSKRPSVSLDNARKMGVARYLLNGCTISMLAVGALVGDWLIRFMYDSRYYDAGPIMVLLCLALMPAVVTNAYSKLLLAEGNSRDFMFITVLRAVLKTSLILFGLVHFGVVGVIGTIALMPFLMYPLVVFYTHRHGGWDPVHDLRFYAIIAVVALAAYMVNQDVIDTFVTQSIADAPGWDGAEEVPLAEDGTLRPEAEAGPP